jgi:hypothetical protein
MASLETLRGVVSVAWAAGAGTVSVTVVIPPSMRAVCDFPGQSTFELGSGTYDLSFNTTPTSD